MTVDGYLAGVRGALRRALGDRLVGVWLAGSAALGDFDPARSDLDVLAIAADPIAASELRALAAAVQEGASGCPARGIELVLYTRDGLADPAGPAFALNVNAGPRMVRHISLDPAAVPRFWFTLDVSIARQAAIALAGPPAREAFPEPPRALVLAAAGDALHWYAARADEDGGAGAVLAACRTLAWLRDGRWRSKAAAVAAARDRLPDPRVADRALALRAGAPAAPPLRAVEAGAVLAVARAALAAAESGARPRGTTPSPARAAAATGCRPA